MSTKLSEKNGNSSSAKSTQSCNNVAYGNSRLRDAVLDTIRQFGPVTISQVVAICGPLVKPEAGRRRALEFDYSASNVKYMARLSSAQQIEIGRTRLITRIVCDLHKHKKIKRISGQMRTKSSEWVVSEWSVLDKGDSNAPAC